MPPALCRIVPSDEKAPHVGAFFLPWFDRIGAAGDGRE